VLHLHARRAPSPPGRWAQGHETGKISGVIDGRSALSSARPSKTQLCADLTGIERAVAPAQPSWLAWFSPRRRLVFTRDDGMTAAPAALIRLGVSVSRSSAWDTLRPPRCGFMRCSFPGSNAPALSGEFWLLPQLLRAKRPSLRLIFADRSRPSAPGLPGCYAVTSCYSQRRLNVRSSRLLKRISFGGTAWIVALTPEQLGSGTNGSPAAERRERSGEG